MLDFDLGCEQLQMTLFNNLYLKKKNYDIVKTATLCVFFLKIIAE